ncbi:unnamed protein product [Blepharisma stoltei]|uniref:Palmitoyltransferase n=1 Tax=Blepharisma stoltei TaxID=1481888 RepID=A0AAU9KD58_9CILI|nr:unnamed protein product [Blepharisma stoltei]
MKVIRIKPTRNHGLNAPINIYQVLSWIVNLFNIIISSLILIPTMNLPSKIIYTILYSTTQIISIIYAYRATICDPTDPLLLSYREKVKRGERPEAVSYQAFCTICNCNVSLKAKHCGQCNRCVDNFDHHCKWLNNCIGQKNYHLFTQLIAILEINMLTITAFGLTQLCEYYVNYDEYVDKVSDISSSINPKSFLILTFIVTIEAAIIAFLTAHLLALHVWLKMKGMTTFEYILSRRNKKQKLTQVGDAKDTTVNIGDHEISYNYTEPPKTPLHEKKSFPEIITEEQYAGGEEIDISKLHTVLSPTFSHNTERTTENVFN